MANKPLKSITFPGLTDKYTVPQIDDTLAVSGAAADAKKTGDEITNLKADLNLNLDGRTDIAFEAGSFEYFNAGQAITDADYYPFSVTRKRTPATHLIYKTKLIAFDGFSFQVLKVDINDYILSSSGWQTSYTITEPSLYRIVLRKGDGNQNLAEDNYNSIIEILSVDATQKKIVSNTEELRASVIDGKLKKYIVLEPGSYTYGSVGQNLEKSDATSTLADRKRTNTPVVLKNATIKASSGYVFNLLGVNSSDVITSATGYVSSYTVTGGTYAVIVRASDGTSIASVDGNNVISVYEDVTGSVSDGSVTPAKLDSDVPADGKVLSYNNGNFEWIDVQTDIDTIKKELESTWNEITDAYNNTGYVVTNVTIGSAVDTTVIQSDAYISAVVECKKSDTFKITGLGGVGARLWAFTDDDYKLISKSTEYAEATNLELTAPADGYFIINVARNDPHSIYIKDLEVILPRRYADLLDNFPESVSTVAECGANWSSDAIPNYGEVGENWADIANLYQSGYIVTNVSVGSTVDTTRIENQAYMSAIVSCNGGDAFKISGTGGDGARLWAFTDKDYKLISKYATAYGTETNLVIVAPSDGYLITSAGWETKALYKGIYASTADYTPTLSELYSLYDSLAERYHDYITKTDLGVDQSGTYHIYQFSFVPETITVTGSDVFSAPAPPKILICGGMHGDGQDAGDQPEMVVGLFYFFKNMCDNWYGNELLTYLRHHVQIELIPVENPWGYVNKSRRNSRGVDLNRNFPNGWTQGTYGTNTYGGTEPFSEAEAQIMRDFVYDNLDALFHFDLHTTGGTPSQDRMIYYDMHSNKNLIVPANDTVVYLSDKWNHGDIPNLDTTIMHGYVHTTAPSGIGSVVDWMNMTVGIPSCIMEAFPNYEDSGLNDNTELAMRMCQEEIATMIIKTIRYFKFNYLSNQRS